MICLGIESTAHTFGVGIVDSNGKVLANVKDSYVTEEGGIVPAEAADHHVRVCDEVIKKALDKAELKIKDIDLIAFSQAPGLGHTLRIGTFAARVLSAVNKIPLIGVNHCIAHLTIGELLTRAKDPVLLYASGANTQVIAYEGGKYRIFGETLDIGVGNFLDSFARVIGLGFPGGPKIYELALKSNKFIELPYSVKGMDVSFGGLLTNLKQKVKSGNYKKEDLCYSVQETVFAMLLEVSERAMAHCDKKELLLGGGVACNIRLQEMAKKMCEDRGAKCYILENQFNVDNGAMIAWQGILEHSAGKRMNINEAVIKPYQRTDEVKVNWRK
ncbi:bifunctional N(6)-L-threonylcarbamoyladenine synthase/serine/threonine protein kinase [Candidatus Woesearchaeota archaeon]|nr:bifunctional N(6)-L-threonylcarbamoyladenine synthase/serine/threonine protein kinase [Candidatus Woesearchaeota archaeon]